MIVKEEFRKNLGFQVDKFIVNAKSRPTGNKAVKAAFHPNGWNS
jgi:hypothetical protein